MDQILLANDRRSNDKQNSESIIAELKQGHEPTSGLKIKNEHVGKRLATNF